GQFQSLQDLDVGPDGLLYVVDNVREDVQVFTPDGDLVRSWRVAPDGEALYGPVGIGIAASVDIYIAVQDYHIVERWSSTGSLLAQWGHFGQQGSADGYFSYPPGVDIGPDGLLYVADQGNDRIVVLDQSGNTVRSWPCVGQRNRHPPVAVAAMDGDQCVVSVPLESSLQLFTNDGTFVREFQHFDGASYAVFISTTPGSDLIAAVTGPCSSITTSYPVREYSTIGDELWRLAN